MIYLKCCGFIYDKKNIDNINQNENTINGGMK